METFKNFEYTEDERQLQKNKPFRHNDNKGHSGYIQILVKIDTFQTKFDTWNRSDYLSNQNGNYKNYQLCRCSVFMWHTGIFILLCAL